jgi:hypothetical protein
VSPDFFREPFSVPFSRKVKKLKFLSSIIHIGKDIEARIFLRRVNRYIGIALPNAEICLVKNGRTVSDTAPAVVMEIMETMGILINPWGSRSYDDYGNSIRCATLSPVQPNTTGVRQCGTCPQSL